MNLDMNLIKNGDACEIALIGRLDAQTSPEAEEVLLEQATNFDSIVLDFSQLGYISSAGLRTLKALRMAVRKTGGSLALKGVSPSVMEIFEMTGFTAFFKFI